MQSKQSSNFIYKIVCKLLHKGPAETQDSRDDLNDRSYEDALLDVQLTSFFRAEYGKKEPPTGVFPRLIQAIWLHRERQEKLANASAIARFRDSLGQKLAAAYRLGARADSGRVLSGGLVTALLLIAMWPSMSRTLPNNNLGTLGLGGTTTAAQTAQPTSTSEDGGQATSSAGQYISPGRIYEEPRFRLEQKTGEDLAAPDDNGSRALTQPNQSNTGKSKADQPQVEQQYQRPAIGQE